MHHADVTDSPDNYDNPWKDVIEHAFPEFMAFNFAEAFAQIELKPNPLGVLSPT